MKIELKVRPFQTPNFVLLEVPATSQDQGFQKLPGVPLSEVDANALSGLCDAFRAEIFKKAGKRDPLVASVYVESPPPPVRQKI